MVTKAKPAAKPAAKSKTAKPNPFAKFIAAKKAAPKKK